MRWVFLFALLLAGCNRRDETPTAPPEDQRPNVIWFSIESLRADHIGCYGYERDTTPNLDALAAAATRYPDAHSVTSWTLASHATMFTGLYPTAHRVTEPDSKLSDAHTTVAEALAAAGYDTMAAVSGPYFRRAHNMQQGFARYDDSPITPADANASADVTNPAMEASITAMLRERKGANKPFFLFGYFWDPHSHYIPPPPYDTMFVPPDAEPIPWKQIQYSPAFQLGKHISKAQLLYQIAQYDGEIRCTDEVVGRILRLLHDLDLWDNTAVIITADHGEEFYDHGHNSHKNTLYVESIHVPLVVKLPHQTEAVVDDRTVNLIDLFPTVLELAGISIDSPQTGQSLLQPARTDRPIFHELHTFWSFKRKSTGEKWTESDQWYAVRRGRYKLVNVETKNRWELYDIIIDPREQHPLGAEAAETLGELQGELESWQETMELLARQWQGGGTAQLSEAEKRKLRSLGYLP